LLPKQQTMKQISLFASILALAIAITVLVMRFQDHKKTTTPAIATTIKETTPFKIAYFQMDSLETNFALYKEAVDKVMDKERSLTSSLTSLQRNFQQRAAQLQQKAPTMTQTEGEAASREMLEMDQKLKEKKATIEQELFDYRSGIMQETRKKIEDYLKQFNSSHQYAYIFAYEPGLIYYRDTAYNITQQVVTGLNTTYKVTTKK
jgi:outer membrane protein